MAQTQFTTSIEMYASEICHHCGTHWRSEASQGRDLDVEIVQELGNAMEGNLQLDLMRCLQCNGIHMVIYRPFLEEMWHDQTAAILDWKVNMPEKQTTG